jgi:xylulokinase
MLCRLADGLDALRAHGVTVGRVLLVGSGSHSRAVQAIAPSLLDTPVLLPPADEYAADDAAHQAAWVLEGDPEPPEWSATVAAQPIRGSPTPHVREAYAEARDCSE